MAYPCEVLSDDAHWLFRQACRTPTRRGDERSSGLTRDAIEKLTGLSKQELRELVQEIAREDLLSFPEFEDSGHFRFRSDHRCDCGSLVAPVGEARLVSRAGGRASARVPSYSYSATELGPRLGSPTYGGRTAQARGRRQATNDPETWNGHMLAEYLAQEIFRRYFGKFPNPVNIEAVRKSVTRWMSEDGVSATAIKSMIDEFVSDPMNMKQGVPVWRSFLAQRHRLLEQATRVEAAAQAETNRLDVNRWSRAGRSSTG